MKRVSISYIMELSFKELKKRDVINLADGKSLGKMTDLTLSFPMGTLVGITVNGKKTNCFTQIFQKSNLYIPQKNIVKIGGDVILVNLSCGESCLENVTTNKITLSPPKQNNDGCFNPNGQGQCCPPINGCFPPSGGFPNSNGSNNGFNKIDLSDY